MDGSGPPDGTPLARVTHVTSGARFDALRTAGLRSVAVATIRHRPMYIAAYGAFVVGALTMAGHPRHLVVDTAIACSITLAYHLVEAQRVRKSRTPDRDVVVLTLVGHVSLGVVFALTGGLRSPMLPMVLGPAASTIAAFGRSPQAKATIAASVAQILVLAALPPSWVGPRVAAPWDALITAVSIGLGLKILSVSLFAVNDAWQMAGGTLDRMREEVLVASASRARSLETIGAKVAHELKNPLASVKGLAQLLERSPCEDRTRERIGVMRGEIERMESILHEYLSFSRPLDDLRPEPVELGALADEVVAVVSARALGAGLTLRREGGPARIAADPRRLKEAMLNLVSNAIEATSPGGTVTLRVAQSGARARVDVVDTGRGMPAELLARIGTPYFTTREGGTGLGVLLARAVLAQHGGELAHDSAPGRGTVATMWLPATPPACPTLPRCGGSRR